MGLETELLFRFGGGGNAETDNVDFGLVSGLARVGND